jgi:hypothetical protein
VRARQARRHEVGHGMRVSRPVRHGAVWTRGRIVPLLRLETLLQTPMCGSRDRRLIFAVPREAQTARGAKASAEVKASCARTAIPLHPHVRCRVEALAASPSVAQARAP